MVKALDGVRVIRERYEAQPEGYPIGVGPLETVWQQVDSEQISAQEGERLVSASLFTAGLSARYLKSLSDWAVGETQRGAGKQVLAMMRLVRAAALACDPVVVSAELRGWIAVAFIEGAKGVLHDAPDGGLLTETQTLGEEALAGVGPHGEVGVRSALLFGLGTLFLHPYFTNAVLGRAEERLEPWRRRAHLQADPFAELADTEMPEPRQALHIAQAYLTRALDLTPACSRAATQKALSDVLIWRRDLGDEVDVAEIVGLCNDALAELGEEGSPGLRMSLLNSLLYFGEAVEAGDAAPVLERPLEAMIKEFGREGASYLILAAARVVGPSAPRVALEALKRSRSLFAEASEELRIVALEYELTALTEALTPQLPLGSPLEASVGEMTRLADREGWNGARRAVALLRLASQSRNTDEEAFGLQLLDQIPETSPIVAAEHAELLAWLGTTLELNMGVNAFRARQWPDCAGWYARALSGWLDLGFDGRAYDTLLRVGDIARRADEPIDVEFLMALAPNAARIETRLGDGATEVIQDLVMEAVVSMGSRGTSPEALHLLWQIAKGARLAPVLASEGRYDPAEDGYGARLLAKIDELRSGLHLAPGLAEGDPDVLLDEELALAAYARPRPSEPGGTRKEQLLNLERAYDEHLTRHLLLGTGAASSAFLGLQAVQARLGDRTVLVSLYLGRTVDGQIAVHVLYMTRDDVDVSVIPHGFPVSMVNTSGLLVNPFALIVEQVRREIQDPPLGRRTVSRDAEHTLQYYLPGLLGHLSARLEEYKATGHDHVCIVPHGPFHYFPFHLLGPAGHPLAEDFAVTYLPQLHLLGTARGNQAPARRGSALGLSFTADQRPGLAPLPEAVPEAREIAALFGCDAVVDARATEQAALAALRQSRAVHLATHGRHNVDAPAFHTLYLHPTAHTDGHLQAHELLGLDLSGLRLVTLSACETALGRFDRGDNLRGLPASFFLAGVQTLIGTLWRVRDTVSRDFFVAFYRFYLGGIPLLDAFVRAQRQTRSRYPQYRDWGAFYFAGDWAERHLSHEEQP